jgi:hypothetical protein
MRLRQIALASSRLDAVVDALERVFGLSVAFRDPSVAHYGLRNAVLPAGDFFIEVVEPTLPDVSAARFLARCGGDAGYMLIFQAADAPAEVARAAGQGARVVETADRKSYFYAHFHPADFGGVLVSFDEVRTERDPLNPDADWPGAGPDWAPANTGAIRRLRSATLACAEPQALAALWSQRLGRPLDPSDPLRLPVARGVHVGFEAADGKRTAIHRIDVEVDDPAGALARAERAGAPVGEGGVLIGGVRFRPVGAVD